MKQVLLIFFNEAVLTNRDSHQQLLTPKLANTQQSFYNYFYLSYLRLITLLNLRYHQFQLLLLIVWDQGFKPQNSQNIYRHWPIKLIKKLKPTINDHTFLQVIVKLLFYAYILVIIFVCIIIIFNQYTSLGKEMQKVNKNERCPRSNSLPLTSSIKHQKKCFHFHFLNKCNRGNFCPYIHEVPKVKYMEKPKKKYVPKPQSHKIATNQKFKKQEKVATVVQQQIKDKRKKLRDRLRRQQLDRQFQQIRLRMISQMDSPNVQYQSLKLTLSHFVPKMKPEDEEYRKNLIELQKILHLSECSQDQICQVMKEAKNDRQMTNQLVKMLTNQTPYQQQQETDEFNYWNYQPPQQIDYY